METLPASFSLFPPLNHPFSGGYHPFVAWQARAFGKSIKITLMGESARNLLTIKDASLWASNHLGKSVTPSNISYLIQYGKVPRVGSNGSVYVNRHDLEAYYKENYIPKEELWKGKLGGDLNWHLSFSQYKESQTTKHVHRLHPYKGKFIPQLVEYFLNQGTDDFKTKSFFKPGDIILDPFCGSGTTLVQSNELGMHAIGIDVSPFNAFISNVKIGVHDVDQVMDVARQITIALKSFQKDRNNLQFERELLHRLKVFNDEFFPSPEYRYKVAKKIIDEKPYARDKEEKFLREYMLLVEKYGITLRQRKNENFLDKWFLQPVRDEIDFVFNEIADIKDKSTKKILGLILSRTIRSCRATTHADLATLKEPVTTTYYCKKHGKICKPLFSILSWWQRYTEDTVKRVLEFEALRSNTQQKCLVGDSRNIDIAQSIKKVCPQLHALMRENKISGIFSSPPYVGLIDYHEQHAYAYDLFRFERHDDLEIGPLYKGQGQTARASYARGVAAVLMNCKPYLKAGYDVFLVANDKHNLYPEIATLANMEIVNEYKRPVLNRVEKDRAAYSETIFHLKESGDA